MFETNLYKILIFFKYWKSNIIIEMNDFKNLIKRDPQVQITLKDMLDRYNKIPYIYLSETGYDTLIQNVILEGILNLMGSKLVDIDKQLKKNIVRIQNL